MKNTVFILLLCLGGSLAWAQHNVMISSSEVRYMVTFEPTTSQYTAWIVPGYNTPNANNPDSEDRGATAQFSLKVPLDFTLTELRDLRGNWDKSPYKLMTPDGFTAPASEAKSAYYVIGKTPQETIYGPFAKGEPIALFTFKGQSGNPKQVQALATNDPFVTFAETKMALHIRSSFYTRSGQRASMTAHPLEQMNGVITLDEVLKQKQTQLGLQSTDPNEDIATLSLQAYPNPATDVIDIKYFSATDQPDMKLDLIDTQGIAKQSNSLTAKAGFNTSRFVVSDLPAGVYFVRGLVQGQPITKKIVKH